MSEIRNDLALMERETIFSVTADNRAARYRVPTSLVVRESALTNGNERLEQLRDDLAGKTQPAPG